MGRLPHIRAQHVRKTGPEPIPALISRRVLERHDSEGKRCFCLRRKKFVTKQIADNREQDHGNYACDQGPRNGLPPWLYVRVKPQRRCCAFALPGVEIAQNLRRSLIAQVRIALEALAYNSTQRSRDAVVMIGHRNGSLLFPSDQASQSGFRLERHLSGEQFGENETGSK